MLMLYLAVFYLVGIGTGHLLWQRGMLTCQLPDWVWVTFLATMPLLLWWEHSTPAMSGQTLRWPVSAGFSPPRPALSSRRIVLLSMVLITGLLRYASHPFEPCLTATDLAFYNTFPTEQAEPIRLLGYVSSYPLVQNTHQTLVVRATEIQINGELRPIDGLLRLKIRLAARPIYGQAVAVTGVLQQPPVFEGFDYRAYLAGKGIHSIMERPRLEVLSEPLQGNPLLRMIYHVRSRGEQLLQTWLPEPYAALANGMLLGIESGIPDDLYEAFNRTGASHTIVISGSNVALLSGAILALGVRLLGRRRALWPTLAGIAFYTFLVGGDASVTRAALMGGLFVTATSIGRRSTALVSLGVACWAMTLINPLSFWDVGFRLSAAATAGLILISPRLMVVLNSVWPDAGRGGPLTGSLGVTGQNLMRGLVSDSVLMTLAATLATMPLLLLYFHHVSLVSLLTNLFIAPAQPFILLWGSLGLLVGLFGLEALAQVVLWIPYLCLVWTVNMVQWTDSWPGGSLVITRYGTGAFLLTYFLLVLVFGGHWVKQQWQTMVELYAAWMTQIRERVAQQGLWGWLENRVIGSTALLSLSFAALIVWQMVLTQPDGYLHVYFLDIGQGDGVLIQTPSGRQVLIDGGSDPQRLLNELGQVMPFWDRSLDLLLLSHPDLDHLGAQLTVPERYHIPQAVAGIVTLTDADGAAWQEAVRHANIPVAVQGAGGWLDLGDGVALWSLWPVDEEKVLQAGIDQTDKNERSLVQKLVFGELEILLTGDAGQPVERSLLQSKQSISADILKIGHHGSDSSTGLQFLEAVNPMLAVIQVGENRYGHPHPDIIERLAGRVILRNDLHGRIHIWSDGTQIWVETERGKWLPEF